jgi:hypothetical protein
LTKRRGHPNERSSDARDLRSRLWTGLLSVPPSLAGLAYRWQLPRTCSPPTAPAPADYLPNTARITITADVWVDPEEVERAFKDVQRQIRAGDGPAGQMPERSLEVIRFIARRTRARGMETWEKRRLVWNKSCPKGWRYSTYSGLRRIFTNFVNGYVRRTYELPNYLLREKTPFEEYRDDWEDGHSGED